MVIANAGGASVVKGVLETEGSQEEMGWDFEVNAMGTVRLFHGVWGLLERLPKDGEGSGDGKGVGRFVVVSSSVGSIGVLEEERYVEFLRHGGFGFVLLLMREREGDG